MWFWKKKLETDTYAIIGLGNPGPEYVGTRHNIGFAIIESLAKEFHIDMRERKFQSVLGKGDVEGKKVFLVKPLTYMNKSGGAVSSIVKYYKIPLENILVIADDLDLPLGTVRLKPSGGAGGHNGHKSIVSSLGTADYPRLRVGIGKQEYGDTQDHVLGKFRRDELSYVNDVIVKCRDAACCFVLEDLETAMNHYNRK